jgi:hypothetical protein
MFVLQNQDKKAKPGQSSTKCRERTNKELPSELLEFFIYLILLVALWPWESIQPLTNVYQESFLGVKAAGAEG